jgi:hypothetical protein
MKYKKKWCQKCQVLFMATTNKHNDCKVNKQNNGDNSDFTQPQRIDIPNYNLQSVLPAFHEIFKFKLPMVNIIPKSLQNKWNVILETVITQVKETNDIVSWKLFMMLCKCIWYFDGRSGKFRQKQKLQNWTNRMDRWMNGSYIELWNEFIGQWNIVNEKIKAKKGFNSNVEELDKQRVKSSIYFARNGDLKGGIKALQSYGIMPLNEQNKKKITDMHPMKRR